MKGNEGRLFLGVNVYFIADRFQADYRNLLLTLHEEGVALSLGFGYSRHKNEVTGLKQEVIDLIN